MSDETQAGQRIEEHAGNPPRPGEAAGGGWPGLGPLLAGLAGASVLVTGAGLIMGWNYTEAFYGRLGVPIEALDLEPAAYFTAKVEIWYALAWSALVAFSGMVAYRFLPPPTSYAPVFIMWPLTLAGMTTATAGCVGAIATGEAAFVYASAFGAAALVVGIFSALQATDDRSAPAVALVGSVMLISLAGVFLGSVPDSLGQHDAEALLAGPQEGSAARLVAAEPLGLPGERRESDLYVTQDVRVVTATNGSYYVVVAGTETVYCLPATRIVRMEYAPDEGR